MGFVPVRRATTSSICAAAAYKWEGYSFLPLVVLRMAPVWLYGFVRAEIQPDGASLNSGSLGSQVRH